MPAANFVWYELMTTDVAAAQAFYGAVIGWGAQDAGHPTMHYTLLTVGSTRVAGLMEIPADARTAGAQPAWLGYVGVEDVDAMAKRLAEAGGTMHRPPQEIPGVGRFTTVSDPQGAAFMLFQPQAADPQAPLRSGTPGTVGWRELSAGEWESAFAFYTELFGWTKAEAVDMGPMGTYQLFAAGGEAIGGMMNGMSTTPRPFWLYYFNVADVVAAAARVTSEGGAVLNGPHPVPGGSLIVQCRDPQGALFALVQPAA